jgi:hypothetical protein
MKMRIAHHAEGRTFAPLIGMAGVCLFLGLVAATMLASLGRIFQSEDRFAKGLTIPADIEVASPLPEPARRAGYLEDGFQKALLDAWRAAPTADPCVVPSLPSLRVLASEHRALLMQYLAAHPAWRVFERRDVLCTARRWRIGSMWLWTLHGFYTPHDLGLWSGGSAATDFQSRTAIRLDSKPRAAPDASETRLKEGTSPRPVRLDKRWPLDSLVVVHCGSVAVELSEQSAGAERRLTKAALRELEAEFKTLLDRKEFTRDVPLTAKTAEGRPSFPRIIRSLSSVLAPLRLRQFRATERAETDRDAGTASVVDDDAVFILPGHVQEQTVRAIEAIRMRIAGALHFFRHSLATVTHLLSRSTTSVPAIYAIITFSKSWAIR